MTAEQMRLILESMMTVCLWFRIGREPRSFPRVQIKQVNYSLQLV